MENNLHNDGLDDFVKNAFEHYEEDPSSDMWERIDADLPPATPPAQPFGIRWFKWKFIAGMAVLILGSGIVAEHFYYKNRLQQLSEQYENADILTNKASGNLTQGNPVSVNPQNDTTPVQSTDNEQVATENTARVNTSETAAEPSTATGQNKKINTKYNPSGVKPNLYRNSSESGHSTEKAVIPTAGKDAKTKISAGSNPAIIGTEGSENKTSRDIKTANPDVAASGGALNKEAITANVDPGLTSNTGAQDGADSGAQDITTARPAFLPALQALGMEIPQVSNAIKLKDLVPGLQAPEPIIQKAKIKTGWYASVQATPLMIYEQFKTPANPPGMGHKPLIHNEHTGSKLGVDLWAKVGKKVNKNFAVETGIGYADITRTSEHVTDFKFHDGFPGGGPHGGHHEHFDFQYNLSTVSGSGSVSVRMEQVDSMEMISDDEPLNIKINTKERVQTIRVPLLLAGSFGNGRLKAVAKAGLVGNFEINKDFQVTGLSSLNPKFKPEHDDPIESDIRTTRIFTLGYLLSAGVDYRLNKSISLSAEPTFSGAFAQQDGFGRPLPALYSVGLNVGITYLF